MPSEKKKILLFKILAILCVVSTIGIFDYWLLNPKPISKVQPIQENLSSQNSSLSNSLNNENIEKKEIKKIEIKQPASNIQYPASSIQLNVPFTSQAPFANWDDLHNEACEEAALIMAKYWLSGEELSKERAEKEILDSVYWQIENWGGHYDLPVEKMVELAKQFFGIQKIEIIYQPTLEDVKKELSKGNLVLAPMAGRLLKNPYFRQPGPIYHVVVVRGYDKKWIITNDPGTKRGENFKYSYQNFFDSIHDWPYNPPDYGQKLSKDEKAKGILKGPKAIIVISQ
jgi:hypothetical protein